MASAIISAPVTRPPAPDTALANVITLALEAWDRGYPTGEWATYKQWADHGAQVRKGERSAQIIKWVTHKTTDNDQTPAADGEQRETRRLLPRVYGRFGSERGLGGSTRRETGALRIGGSYAIRFGEPLWRPTLGVCVS